MKVSTHLPTITASLVLVGSLCVHVSAEQSWRACILSLDQYFQTPDVNSSSWSKAATTSCGFSAMSGDRLIESGLLDNRTITFVGDSTAIRMYVYTVNRLVTNPEDRVPYGKVADAPPRLSKRILLRQRGSYVVVRFFRMMFISTAESVFTEAITSLSSGRRGLIVVTAGNWDLNWKLQLNQPMPGLDGPVHNWPVAQVYWTRYVDRMFTVISSALKQTTEIFRPVVVFREQYLPNCAASRFSAKKRRYRQCRPLIRPVVVPFYRRTLQRVAWAMDIPVIPGFIADRPSCTISDGLHLDYSCMAFEQELVWNVGRLLLLENPIRGLPPKQSLNEPIKSVDFGNVARFQTWWTAFARSEGLQPSQLAKAAQTLAPLAETDEPLVEDVVTVGPTPPSAMEVLSPVNHSRALEVELPKTQNLTRRRPTSAADLVTHFLIAAVVLIVLACPVWFIFR